MNHFFDAQMKNTFRSDKKRQYHREGRMSKAEVMMIIKDSAFYIHSLYNT